MPAVDFDKLTFGQWTVLFNGKSASMQLSSLYLSSPRIRAKIAVATGVTMAELLSGEAILRQRISEIADVALERVLIEYVETTAPQEIDRGSWALSIGISALVAPSPLSLNDTLVMSTVDVERQRILNRLLFGGMVRGSNVTIASLQLFGSPMRLLSAHLDGEAFYQIDSTPWVGLSLVVATSSGGGSGAAASTVVTATTNPSSSSGAFQNLRLRFVLARFLQRLRIDTSSILVRDARVLPATQTYGVPTLLMPIELHVGGSATTRTAVDAYVRNASLATALRSIEPQWSLHAVEVDGRADDIGRGSGSVAVAGTAGLWCVAIGLRVDGLTLAHVQRRGPAILDATKTLLSHIVDTHNIRLGFGPVTAVSDHDGTSSAVSLTMLGGSGAGSFASSGSDDSQATAPLIDRGFIVQIRLSTVGDAPTLCGWYAFLNDAVTSALAITDARSALGFVEPFELSLTTYAAARVQFLQISFPPMSDTRVDAPFVRITLTLKPHNTSAVMDVFTAYRIRCALLQVLDRVFVNDADLTPVETVPLPELAVRLAYVVRVAEESQRSGMQRAVHSWRLRQVLEAESRFVLVGRTVELHADGSMPHSAVLPGTGSSIGLATPSTSSPAVRMSPDPEPTETVYAFADPWPTQNPSVSSFTVPSCPSPLTVSSGLPTYYGCLVLHWSSEFLPRTVFIRNISVTRGVVLQSATLPLLSSTQSTVAPWLPASSSEDNEPRDWALQFLSTSVQNASVNLTLAFASVPASTTFYPVLKLSMALRLTDTQRPGSSMQVVSVRQYPVSLVPLTFGSAPAAIVQQLAGLVTTASRNEMPGSMEANVSIVLAQQSILGMVDSTSAVSAWTWSQPACLSCLPMINACQQLNECVAISQCGQRALEQRLLLYSDQLQQSNVLFDISDVMQSCLASPSPRAIQWSSAGRLAFRSSLQCIVQASCAMAVSSVLERRVVVRYAPRQHVIRIVPSLHFPLSLSFLLDIDGGVGASTNGATRIQTSKVFSEVTAPTLAALRELVLSLYGDLGRGLDVTTAVSGSTTEDALAIRIQYSFLDAGAIGLPFVSVVTASTADPLPVVDTITTESLMLFTETM